MAEESLETKLARIEEILIGYIKRLDERCLVRADILKDYGARLDVLEEWRQQAKGGWIVLCVLSACSAGVGGLVVGILTVYYTKVGP